MAKCAGCDGPVPLPERVRPGPARRYCSKPCRLRAERRRRSARLWRALAARWRDAGDMVRASRLDAIAANLEAPVASVAPTSTDDLLPAATDADFERWA